ncbi:metal ABC transporter ATP-binding protein [Cedecea colo]|uniref:ABC transporter ATP-binding protein n=1 Tax=Cedecea colo TaxID=2552946 RepID=A0ABX0VNM6_9ENTR|nr:ABC transporter ATP-binding protein [Cedecea colo]NIY48557.1 ABC transporter ATP-binding protein [Cedecea colo]
MITLEHLVAGYHDKAVTRPLNGTFAAGSMTAIIGANGTGKSTLLKTLLRLQPPVSGHISFAGGSAPRAAWLPQLAEMDRQFPATVYDVACMGNWPDRGLFSGFHRQHRQHVYEALERVGLSELHRQPIETLSGGQFQRMLFARLLVQNAPLVLLDEPFSGIDAQTSGFLMKLICQMHDAGRTIIAVLHDNALVKCHFPQVLLLSPEACRWGRAAEILPHYPSTSLNLALSA